MSFELTRQVLTYWYMVVKGFRCIRGDRGQPLLLLTGFAVFPLYADSGRLLAFVFVLGPYMDLVHSSELKKCPRCSSHLVHRSRRRGLIERVAHALLQISPYRCDECDHRYFRWRSSHHTRMHRAA